MEKNRVEAERNENDLTVKGKTDGNYEISSTGYGLQSVEKDNDESGPASCGGL